jgi:membrane-associated phospholipid phosphatase
MEMILDVLNETVRVYFLFSRSLSFPHLLRPLASTSQCSLLVSSISFLSCFYYQNAFTLVLFLGAIVNAIFGKILKSLFSIKRPSQSKRHHINNGMPSSHANSLSFFLIYLTLGAWNISFSSGLLTLFLTSFYTFSVCYCRICRTRDHSLDQILGGLFFGSCTGSLVYFFILPVVTQRSNSFLS